MEDYTSIILKYTFREFNDIVTRMLSVSTVCYQDKVKALNYIVKVLRKVKLFDYQPAIGGTLVIPVGDCPTLPPGKFSIVDDFVIGDGIADLIITNVSDRNTTNNLYNRMKVIIDTFINGSDVDGFVLRQLPVIANVETLLTVLNTVYDVLNPLVVTNNDIDLETNTLKYDVLYRHNFTKLIALQYASARFSALSGGMIKHTVSDNSIHVYMSYIPVYLNTEVRTDKNCKNTTTYTNKLLCGKLAKLTII